MASLYESLLTDPHIEFPTSTEQGQRLGQLRQTFVQAGLSKSGVPTAKPLQTKADPNAGPFAGAGLGQGLDTSRIPLQGGARNRPSRMTPPPKAALPEPPGDSSEVAPEDKQFDLDTALAKAKKQFGPKPPPGDDIDATIRRIQAEYESDRAQRAVASGDPGTGRYGRPAMTPTQGPDTGSINPNAGGDPAAFYKTHLPYALKVAKETGTDPRLVLAQVALETGYGAHAPNNNYFGIKGPGSEQATWEDGPNGPYRTTASFKTYRSPQESYDDWANLMKTNPVYRGVLKAPDLNGQIDAMAPYATDRNYTAKLRAIAQQFPDPSGQPPPQTGTPQPPPTQVDPSTPAPYFMAGNQGDPTAGAGPGALKRGGYFNKSRMIR